MAGSTPVLHQSSGVTVSRKLTEEVSFNFAIKREIAVKQKNTSVFSSFANKMRMTYKRTMKTMCNIMLTVALLTDGTSGSTLA